MSVNDDANMEIVPQGNKQWPQWMATLIVSLNFFTAGICFLWSSPSLAILQSENSPIRITNSEASWIAAFLPIGCGVGPLMGAWCARHIGPKTTTILSSIPFTVGFVLILIANSPEWLYASRFFSGFAVGFGQTASPIYIAEIAEMKYRGALLSFITFMMGIGGLFITILGPYFTLSIMALMSTIFPMLLLVLMNFLPESPYFLMRMQKEDCAKNALMWFRGQTQALYVKEELDEIKVLTSDNMRLRDSVKLILSGYNLKKLGIVTLTFMGQSFSGAIVVMFFQEQLYSKAKVPIPSEIAVIITAAISNVSGFISLFFVDRWGRRPLLLLSTIGCAASTSFIGLYLNEMNRISDIPYINWFPVVALNMLQIFFYFGLSPVPTTQLGEIFCSNVKEIAFCYSFIVAAIGGVIITKLFQLIDDAYGLPTVFWCISSITVIIFVFMLFFIPETKGKTLAEIQSSLFNEKESMDDLFVITVTERYMVNNCHM